MKTIRLIELFAGYGSQLMALKRLAKEKNLKIESYRVSEWETGAIKSYTSVHHHGENFDIDNLSFDKVMDCLEKLVISYNGKVPMTRDEMKRRGEEWCREILRDMIVSKNLGSVTRITGDKLGIVDRDKYTYMMTYSFPCTNLSLLGKQEGMDKDSGT
jgi:DNA (cytosine-5)-methyltransferase 1